MWSVKETGSDKWIMIVDGKVRYTSDKDDAQIFFYNEKEIPSLYPELQRLYDRGCLEFIMNMH